MGVDEDRQQTASARRRRIIDALNDGFDLRSASSHLTAFRELVRNEEPHHIITNSDIDGLVSSQMLCATAGWRIAAMFDRNGDIRVHPDFISAQSLIDSHMVFGVDIFSPLFSGASNHPVYFGATSRTPSSIREPLHQFDNEVRHAVLQHHTLNLSAWVEIGASVGSRWPHGLPYKYPLGTAQLLLAVLEAGGFNPRIYDRQYLPWMIANCDGGVESIRRYPWNVETWWSALAAAVGPASHSEALYRLVTSQRPSEFLDVDRRLRYEEPDRSRFLNTRWNLVSSTSDCIATITGLLSDLSGWPDPFLGGAKSIGSWLTTRPTRNVMSVDGITKLNPRLRDAHLDAARISCHLNFSVFKERGTALGWSLACDDPELESLLGNVALVEDVSDDEPTVPDLLTDYPL